LAGNLLNFSDKVRIPSKTMHVVPTPPSYLNDKNISEQTPWLTWIVKNDELRDFDTQKKFSYTGRGQKKKFVTLTLLWWLQKGRITKNFKESCTEILKINKTKKLCIWW